MRANGNQDKRRLNDQTASSFEEDIAKEINDWMFERHPKFYDCSTCERPEFGHYDAYYKDDERFERFGPRKKDDWD